MECVLLGTGGMMPMPGRPLTAVAVRTGGAVYLFDCGEGTQVPYKALHVGMRALRLVAVTHLHADHCLGLPGLLMLRSQMEDPAPLTLVGPRGLERFTRNVVRDLACRITFPLRFEEIDPRQRVGKGEALPRIYEDELVRLCWLPLRHSVFCVGYRLEERQRPGRFSPEAALARGLPPGPAYGRLQAGEPAETPAGEIVRPEEVMGPPRRGRHVAFCTDTAPCQSLYRLLGGVDLAFLEGMFLPAHAEEARLKKHLPVTEAARISLRAEAQQTVLVHLSPRYDNAQGARVDEVARGINPHCRRGRDGERIEVKLPEQ
jgi:ribonuclease Z